MSDGIADALAEAVRYVQAVPEKFQAAAFPVVLGELLGSAIPQSRSVRQNGGADVATQQVLPSQLPPAATIKQKASRLEKALYAVAVLSDEGQAATAQSIDTFLRERVATSVTKLSTVLHTGVPRLLNRSKKDGVFAYSVTTAGLDALAAVGRPESGS